MLATAKYPDPRTADFHYLQKTYAQHDTAGQLKGLKEEGYALIPGVISRDQCAAIKAQIDLLKPFGFDRDDVGAGSHYKCVFNRSPFWLQYTDYPGVIELAEASMGAECHLIGMSAWRSWPGKGGAAEGPLGIHTDEQLFHVDGELLQSGRVELPIMICTAHYYLEDIHIDLCPTWVLPGSHLIGRRAHTVSEAERRHYNGVDIQPVLVRAGDVLFFRSEVWHSGSANRSQEIRYLLQVHYGHRFMAQKFSPYLDFRFNHEVVSQATPRQRRLLGDHKQSNYD